MRFLRFARAFNLRKNSLPFIFCKYRIVVYECQANSSPRIVSFTVRPNPASQIAAFVAPLQCGPAK